MMAISMRMVSEISLKVLKLKKKKLQYTLHLQVQYIFQVHLKKKCNLFCKLLMKIRTGCFFYSVSLPRGAMGWSAVYDCVISCSYSPTF